MIEPSEALIVGAGEGEALWFSGARMTVKAGGDDTGELFSLVEVTAPEGRGTPLHTDPFKEMFYVLEGRLLFHVEGREQAAGPGDTVMVRRGTRHAFLVTSDEARFLVLSTPAGGDRFFREGGEPATQPGLPPAGPPDTERLMAAARSVGVEILGPPPFARPGA